MHRRRRLETTCFHAFRAHQRFCFLSSTAASREIGRRLDSSSYVILCQQLRDPQCRHLNLSSRYPPKFSPTAPQIPLAESHSQRCEIPRDCVARNAKADVNEHPAERTSTS